MFLPFAWRSGVMVKVLHGLVIKISWVPFPDISLSCNNLGQTNVSIIWYLRTVGDALGLRR